MTELQRRYGREGDEVLGALRAVVSEKGRIDPADVDRVATYPERGLGVLCIGNATAYDHGAVARAALGSS